MNIAAQRLQSQRISGEKFDTPEEVVRWMGAVQAQDYGQAVWAIGVRMKRPSLEAVEKAIVDRKILLTWPMRGTIHFVPVEDAKWMVETLAYARASRPNWHQKLLKIDESMLEKVRNLVTSTLQGGGRFTRAQLMELFESNDLPTKEQRGYSYISHLAETGVLCQAPLDGKQQTFVLLDEWVPHSRKLGRTDAVAELAQRYFKSHGPASIQDFANWTGLGMIEAKQGLETAGSTLCALKEDEKEYWLSAEMAEHLGSPRGVHLLPGYDEFLLGYKDRTAVLRDEHARYIVPGNNGVFKPVIVMDGQVVGIWKRTAKKSCVEVSFTLFPGCIVSPGLLEEEAATYASFLGLPLKVTTG